MTSLRLICSLGPPPIKNPGYVYAWHFGDFRKIFLPNIGEDQKKSCDYSVGPLAGTAPYYGKSNPG